MSVARLLSKDRWFLTPYILSLVYGLLHLRPLLYAYPGNECFPVA